MNKEMSRTSKEKKNMYIKLIYTYHYPSSFSPVVSEHSGNLLVF